jgi:hypothetical protein
MIFPVCQVFLPYLLLSRFTDPPHAFLGVSEEGNVPPRVMQGMICEDLGND